jgi:hypothetical protein
MGWKIQKNASFELEYFQIADDNIITLEKDKKKIRFLAVLVDNIDWLTPFHKINLLL